MSIDSGPFANSLARPFRRRLLTWFRAHRRDLPWRHTRDPYRIWVSEVMLQQTQVATVIPYYERFLKVFPHVESLAAASDREVLRVWEGMGYYRRARDLHRAAKEVMKQHAGKVPDDPNHFGALPGVGRYMLGAVLSQAFDRRLPILEANSLRVLARLVGCRQDPQRGAVKQRLWRTADQLLPRRHVGEYNQALMELGALVCKPKRPLCGFCPAKKLCSAHVNGWQERIPVKRRLPKITAISELALVIRRGRHVLLLKRPDRGRWAGFWEFPHGPIQAHESYQRAARRLAKELAGLCVRPGRELGTIRHGITRFQIDMTCLEATAVSATIRMSLHRQARWLTPEALAAYPLAAPQRRLAARLTAK